MAKLVRSPHNGIKGNISEKKTTNLLIDVIIQRRVLVNNNYLSFYKTIYSISKIYVSPSLKGLVSSGSRPATQLKLGGFNNAFSGENEF